MFFFVSSVLDLYGRPAMIFSAFSSVMPGSFMRSSLLALLMSMAGIRLACAAMCVFVFGLAASDLVSVVVVPCAANAAIGSMIANATAESVQIWDLRIMRVSLRRAFQSKPPTPRSGQHGDGS